MFESLINEIYNIKLGATNSDSYRSLLNLTTYINEVHGSKGGISLKDLPMISVDRISLMLMFLLLIYDQN